MSYRPENFGVGNFPEIDFGNHDLIPVVSKIAEITSVGESHIGAWPVSGKMIHFACAGAMERSWQVVSGSVLSVS